MEASVFDKRRLPSRHVTEGPRRAPHRSYHYAMGLSREQIHQPFVGVASCRNEAEGMRGGPGMREMLSTTAALYGQCVDEKVAFITDGCFSAGTRGFCIRHVGPEAALGGPIGLLDDGGIDAVAGRLSVRLPDAELEARRAKWTARETDYRSGAIWKFAQGVGPARFGAVTQPGGAAEVKSYADI